MKIKIIIVALLVIFGGLFCLVKFNIINIEKFNIFNFNVFNKPKLAMDKIKFAERYPSEFNKFPDNTNGIIEQNATLSKHYSPNEAARLTPAIVNLNEGIPLEQARIQLIFGEGVVVEEHQGWDVQEVNRRYSYKFNEPINNIPLNTGYSIFVKFPKPGKYQITALIDGQYLESIKEVNYFIEVYE